MENPGLSLPVDTKKSCISDGERELLQVAAVVFILIERYFLRSRFKMLSRSGIKETKQYNMINAAALNTLCLMNEMTKCYNKKQCRALLLYCRFTDSLGMIPKEYRSV
jgi:hypothetical protein